MNVPKTDEGRAIGRKLMRFLVAMTVFSLLLLGVVSEATSLSLKEFDRLSGIEKENFITTVLHFNYYTYKNNPETASKARCMEELGRRELRSGEPYLSALVTQRIDTGRSNAARSPAVEKIIKELIDRECETY